MSHGLKAGIFQPTVGLVPYRTCVGVFSAYAGEGGEDAAADLGLAAQHCSSALFLARAAAAYLRREIVGGTLAVMRVRLVRLAPASPVPNCPASLEA
jgi:hypothetical protein